MLQPEQLLMSPVQDTQKTTLLIVDDDVKLCRLIKDYLEPLGYEITVAHNGREGLRKALEGQFDAVILDVMMPEVNGIEVLKELRTKSNVPVLMLTGLGDETDRIAGLEIGADDYLPKTFSTRELLARLRAVIRRSRLTAIQKDSGREPAIVVGELRIDPETRTASVRDMALVLTPVEFDILLSLARAAGRIKTRESLLLEIADRDFEVFDRSIDVHVSSIRRKLDDDPRNPRFIQTVRSAGYMLLKPGSGLE
jgi:two-component system response regulator CpxR